MIWMILLKGWQNVNNLKIFSSNLEKDTDVTFVTCNGLSDAKEALINFKIYKTFLGVVYLSEIKNLNLVKGESKGL